MEEMFSRAPFKSGGFRSAGVPPAVFEFAAARKMPADACATTSLASLAAIERPRMLQIFSGK